MNETKQTKTFIAIDWGTTNVRAILFSQDGEKLDLKRIKSEIDNKNGQDFVKKFNQLCQDWPISPTLATGMIGSKQGWVEAPYLPCPISPDKIADKIKFFKHKNYKIGIVPGLKLENNNKLDVMRGEETQILGLLNMHKNKLNGDVILPGTHCKWVKIRNGKIKEFRTYMSGELFNLLARKSMLRHSVKKGKIDTEYAKTYIDNLHRRKEDWLGNLFAIRATDLLKFKTKSQLKTQISINLIYGEIIAALNAGFCTHKNIFLVGKNNTQEIYSLTLKKLGVKHKTIADFDLAFDALFNIAKQIKLF